MKVALVHDWLTGQRGGEKVLEALTEIFPDADLFTLVHKQGSVSNQIENRKITTSFIQKLPHAVTRYQYYLPLMPLAIEQFDLSAYDLVISTSHCVAKGARKGPRAKHICYCFTPMRYIWDQYDQYFGPKQAALPVRLLMRVLRGGLQRWDASTAQRVDHFIADSQFVAGRIRRYYDRDATVIYPPCDTEFYRLPQNSANRTQAPYLVVSALVPYKNIELAVHAFNENGKPLKIVGKGPEKTRLEKMARPNIQFLGWQSNEEIRRLYQTSRALIFPGIEDFGIVPVEAMASGLPVIALGQGGAKETVKAEITGLFFDQQDVHGLNQAIHNFESKPWNAAQIRRHAESFSLANFLATIRNVLGNLYNVPHE